MLANYALPLTTAPRFGVAWAIALYQRHLSPLKGFRCAHRVLHRGCSCSQFARRVVERKGVRQAIVMTLGRFQKCKAAYLTLAGREGEGRRSKWDYLEPGVQAMDCALSGLDCGALDCGACAF